MITPAPSGRRTPARPATMKQVAALAGVGTKTVSRVINMEPNVTEATASRVWAAIDALDYQADMRAGSLRRLDGRTNSIGLLVARVDNPFAGEVHRGVEEVARQRGALVLASSHDNDPAHERAVVNDLIRRRVDGIIIDSTSADSIRSSRAVERGVPVVFVDRCPTGLATDGVFSDSRSGAAAATRHLIERGHRRIALLTDRLSISTAVERRQGFADELTRAGIRQDETTVITELTDPASATRALTAAMTSENPPTAVFSTQNLITIGALVALRNLGLQHRVAFVGFDDLPLADLLDPAVTVVRQVPRALGRVAAERIFQRLDGVDLPVEHIVLPIELIERGSGEILPAAPS